MRSPVRSSFAAVLAAGLVAALAGCGSGGGSAAPGDSAVQLVAEGTLTTCTHLPYEPFQSRQGDKIVGFDVDMIDLVAKQLGVTQQIVDTPFDNIQTGADMNAGTCDVGAAAMTINDTRRQNIDFSDPYFDATQALLVKKSSGIADVGGLSGKKVGVQNSTTGQEYAQKNVTGAQITGFEDLGLLLTAVKTGQVDAAISDNGPSLDFVKKNPELAVTKEFDTKEQYGFGVRKGNTALAQQINKAISTAKSDGTYDTLYRKWFGKAPGQK